MHTAFQLKVKTKIKRAPGVMSGAVINPRHQSNLCGVRKGGETRPNQFSKYCSPCIQPVPYQLLSCVGTVWPEIALQAFLTRRAQLHSNLETADLSALPIGRKLTGC